MKFVLLISAVSLLVISDGVSQSVDTKKAITFSGYGEIYYAYDFSNPQNHIKQPFLYTYNRHNTVALNLGLIKAYYSNKNIRANISLMSGTYSNDNLLTENGTLKSVYEANIGFKASKTKKIWIDVGVMSSHIGWESAIGKDNYTLTRSLAAENSPYYETGIKLTYTSKNEKWVIAALLLNGWQRMERVDGNNTIAIGHQVSYKPNSIITINSSSYIGNDKPDVAKQMRYFHDLYGLFQLSKIVALVCGFDFGAEQKDYETKRYNYWYNSTAILRLQSSKKTFFAARGEFFHDKNGVIIATTSPNGFRVFGYSMGIDHFISEDLLWRVEYRGFTSRDKIFSKNSMLLHSNSSITTSLSITL